jgi:predicted aspartyl protease
MDETIVDVVLKANDRKTKARLLVDTGSAFTWVRAGTLRQLQLEPTDEDTFETIDGRLVRRKLGFLEVECAGRSAPTLVVFARKSDSEVLGLHALEGLRLELDPVRGELRKIKAVRAF